MKKLWIAVLAVITMCLFASCGEIAKALIEAYSIVGTWSNESITYEINADGTFYKLTEKYGCDRGEWTFPETGKISFEKKEHANSKDDEYKEVALYQGTENFSYVIDGDTLTLTFTDKQNIAPIVLQRK